MSGGTPVGGGYMRQRHSQGYASSSGDDFEDDACSSPVPQSQLFPRSLTYAELVETFLWIASAIFIIYYGDRHSSLVHLLWHDNRIRRIPLCIGMLGVGLNFCFFFYTSMVALGVWKTGEKWEISYISALPFITILGLISFCLFSFALWPIFSFLTLPLVFTLFMACMVIVPHSALGAFKPHTDAFRMD